MNLKLEISSQMRFAEEGGILLQASAEISLSNSMLQGSIGTGKIATITKDCGSGVSNLGAILVKKTRTRHALFIILAAFLLLAGASMKETSLQIEIYRVQTGRVEKVDRVVKSDAEWKKILTPEQYEITRAKGTERPFSRSCAIPRSGKGVYQCVGCGTDLFAYGTKFESGTGWPSFFEPVSPLNIKLEEDYSLGMAWTEVLCARCGAHLGHVFDDGPPPTGKRYCINTVALKLSE